MAVAMETLTREAEAAANSDNAATESQPFSESYRILLFTDRKYIYNNHPLMKSGQITAYTAEESRTKRMVRHEVCLVLLDSSIKDATVKKNLCRLCGNANAEDRQMPVYFAVVSGPADIETDLNYIGFYIKKDTGKPIRNLSESKARLGKMSHIQMVQTGTPYLLVHVPGVPAKDQVRLPTKNPFAFVNAYIKAHRQVIQNW